MCGGCGAGRVRLLAVNTIHFRKMLHIVDRRDLLPLTPNPH